eukprot:SAG31_NODE_656_length_13120_cov_10.091237_3_plen_316_part_00
MDAFDASVPPYGRWVQLAPLHVARLGLAACVVKQTGCGKEFIFAAGGFGCDDDGAGKVLGGAELYDPLTNAWTNCACSTEPKEEESSEMSHNKNAKWCPTMRRPRWAASACTYRDGFVEVLGGQAADGGVLSCCELYSLEKRGFLGWGQVPISTMWKKRQLEVLPPMIWPRAFFGVVSLPSVGAVIAFGGQREQCPSVRDAEILNLRGETVPIWRPLPAMVSTRRAFAVVLAPALERPVSFNSRENKYTSADNWRAARRAAPTRVCRDTDDRLAQRGHKPRMSPHEAARRRAIAASSKLRLSGHDLETAAQAAAS